MSISCKKKKLAEYYHFKSGVHIQGDETIHNLEQFSGSMNLEPELTKKAAFPFQVRLSVTMSWIPANLGRSNAYHHLWNGAQAEKQGEKRNLCHYFENQSEDNLLKERSQSKEKNDVGVSFSPSQKPM